MPKVFFASDSIQDYSLGDGVFALQVQHLRERLADDSVLDAGRLAYALAGQAWPATLLAFFLSQKVTSRMKMRVCFEHQWDVSDSKETSHKAIR
jgi:hypothetical protein